MREHWQRMLTLTVMLLASLISAVPVRAETVEAVFRKGSSNYTFTISSDHLLELNSPDIGKTYGSAILFRNDTDADMKVTLASTEELTSGTEVYKRSYEHIYDDTQDYFSGKLSDSAFAATLKPGETRTVHFDYTLDPENARKPDNALMGQHMEWRFTFVGEYDKSPEATKPSEGAVSAESAEPMRAYANGMLDTDAGALTVAAGAVGLAAGMMLLVVGLKRGKKNDS